MTKKYNHIHRFRRDKYSTGRAFYYCTLDCTFKIDVKHSLGKLSLCNKCGKPFEMNEYSIRAAKPKCMDCVERRSESSIANVEELDNILGVTLNANHVDKFSESAVHKTETRTNSVQELQNKLSNLTIKEYQPEDDDDAL